MKLSPKSLLEDEVDLLVRHFGIQRVRAALAKADPEPCQNERQSPFRAASNRKQSPHPTIDATLDSIKWAEPAKYRLLKEFLARLRSREILPESEDIRLFAQVVGLKDIRGKSRKDLIPPLMRFLIERPIEVLEAEIQRAGDISQQQRSAGFSVLTDKILGQK